MKKVALFTFLSAISCACAYSAVCFSPAFEVKAEDRTIEYINITTQEAVGPTLILLNTDKAIPTDFSSADTAWYINGEKTATPASVGTSASFYLGWNGNNPQTQKGYKHFQLRAGTTLFSQGTTDYVLENDYNFWWTQHSGDAAAHGFLFQHGGKNSYDEAAKGSDYEIPSVSFEGALTGSVGGDEDGHKCWNLNIPYKISSELLVKPTWLGNVAFVDRGEGYELFDFNSICSNCNTPFFITGASIPNDDGTVFSRIFWDPLDMSDGVASGEHVSFYFPKGTLLGGYCPGFAFMIEKDAYFEAYSNGTVGGVYSTPHDYVKKDATCGHPGNVEYYTCSRHANEGEVFLKQGDDYVKTTLDKVQYDIEHSFTFVAEQANSCDKDGMVAHYECSNCHKLALKEGDEYRLVEDKEILIPAEHTLVHHDAVPFTCHSDGQREHEECLVCHKFYISDDGELAEAKESDLIIAKHHTPFTVEGKEATCLEGGYTASKKCSVCDEIIEESKEIPALGHRYGGWKVDDDGEHISHYCERCYQVETVALTNNEDFTYTVIEEASGSSKGLALYSSEKYGSFYVELPMAPSKGDATMTNIIVSSALAVVAIGVSIGGFFLIKKKFAKTK